VLTVNASLEGKIHAFLIENSFIQWTHYSVGTLNRSSGRGCSIKDVRKDDNIFSSG